MVNAATNVATNTVNNLNETINNTIISFSQNCSAVDYTQQTLVFLNITGGSYGNIVQSADNQVNLTCLQQNSTNSSFAETLANNVKQTVTQTATSQGLSAALNLSTNVQNVITNNTTTIVNSTTISNVQTCLASKATSQNISFTNIDSTTFGDITQSVVSEITEDCVQKNTVTQSAVSNIANSIASLSSQSATSGCDTSVLLFLIIGICVVILGLIFFAPSLLGAINPFKGGSKNVSNNVYSVIPTAPPRSVI